MFCVVALRLVVKVQLVGIGDYRAWDQSGKLNEVTPVQRKVPHLVRIHHSRDFTGNRIQDFRRGRNHLDGLSGVTHGESEIRGDTAVRHQGYAGSLRPFKPRLLRSLIRFCPLSVP